MERLKKLFVSFDDSYLSRIAFVAVILAIPYFFMSARMYVGAVPGSLFNDVCVLVISFIPFLAYVIFFTKWVGAWRIEIADCWKGVVKKYMRDYEEPPRLSPVEVENLPLHMREDFLDIWRTHFLIKKERSVLESESHVLKKRLETLLS
ncbi:MAG: hypothetical protein HGA67_01900 [Candidatus Yonathbacteria bacterium]|nr:hypothetical protein [Candidatus Yonathbacteria bacterium]